MFRLHLMADRTWKGNTTQQPHYQESKLLLQDLFLILLDLAKCDKKDDSFWHQLCSACLSPGSPVTSAITFMWMTLAQLLPYLPHQHFSVMVDTWPRYSANTSGSRCIQNGTSQLCPPSTSLPPTLINLPSFLFLVCHHYVTHLWSHVWVLSLPPPYQILNQPIFSKLSSLVFVYYCQNLQSFSEASGPLFCLKMCLSMA